MDFLGDFLGAVGSGLVSTLKISAPALIAGAVVKHGRKATGWIPNDLIPVGNLILGTAIGTFAAGGDAQSGAAVGLQTMTGATTIHQIVKIGTRSLFEKVFSKKWERPIEKKIGPGDRLSL